MSYTVARTQRPMGLKARQKKNRSIRANEARLKQLDRNSDIEHMGPVKMNKIQTRRRSLGWRGLAFLMANNPGLLLGMGRGRK